MPANGQNHDLCFLSPGWCTTALLAGSGDVFAGGAEVQMARVGKALARRGVRVAFVVLDLPAACRHFTHELPVKVYPAYQPGKGLPVARYFMRTVPSLWRALSRADARVYYARGATGLAGIVAACSRWRRSKFVLAIANDHDLDSAPPLRPWDRLLFRMARRLADSIIVQTRSQEERLVQLGLKGVLIPSACELPEQTSSDFASRTVLWAGRGRRVKRPELFIELARRLPDVRFTMALARMRRDEAYYEKVSSEAASLPNLECLPAVPFAHMPSLYARAWALVNTSESEGFSNTFLEAWARKIPVVASVDPDGLLSRGGLGFHCESVDAMAEAVQRLWQDVRLRDAVGQRARSYVLSEHSLEVVTARYLDLLSTLGAMPDGPAAEEVANAGAPP